MNVGHGAVIQEEVGMPISADGDPLFIELQIPDHLAVFIDMKMRQLLRRLVIALGLRSILGCCLHHSSYRWR
jgi:hypothetical protein